MKADPITDSEIWASLANGTIRPETVAARVANQPALLPEVFAGLDEPKARIKFGCAKVLLLVSERSPKTMLLFWDRLTARMEDENKILQWSAMLTLGNLAVVAPLPDVQGLLPRLLAPIAGPVMITAANAMRSATRFALAQPRLAGAVSRKILAVEQGEYQTAECRNVVLGHALQMLDQLFPLIKQKGPVLDLARRQLGNSRKTTRKRAEGFLKKHDLK